MNCEESFIAHDNQQIYGDHRWMKHRLLALPRFQLRQLTLSQMHHDDHNRGYAGLLPRFLYRQSNLELLDIRDTKMEVDAFPWWLIDTNANLQVLIVENCSLSSSFQPPKYPDHRPHGKLSILGIDDNNIHGTIPPHICTQFPRLYGLYLWSNSLTGGVSEQLSNCSCLTVLDVS